MDRMKALHEIESDVSKFAARIGASNDDLPTYGVSRDFGYPHIEVTNGEYHFVVIERGEEICRKSSASYDDLLYWIFESVTSKLAFDYELKNRIADQDCRRIAFPKKIELIGRISPAMASRLSQEIDAILHRFPYDDEPVKALDRR